MSNQTTIEQRLTTLEKTVDQLQNQLKNQTNSDNWLQQLIGSISDEELFGEALEYGRAFRQADQPIDNRIVLSLKKYKFLSINMKLTVILEPSDEGGYTVYVPSLPGCISEGDDINAALDNIQEAIELYLDGDEFSIKRCDRIY
jgi:predicted RNase H-like HicB family nuclease